MPLLQQTRHHAGVATICQIWKLRLNLSPGLLDSFNELLTSLSRGKRRGHNLELATLLVHQLLPISSHSPQALPQSVSAHTHTSGAL